MHKDKNYSLALFLSLLILCTAFIAAGDKPLVAESSDSNITYMEVEATEEIIRFHVLAHNDSPAEQSVKDVVRDEVMHYLSSKIEAEAGLWETKSSLVEEKEKVKEIAERSLHKKGFDHTVDIVFAPVSFPTRLYGARVYPAGEYDAFQIIIGDGRGENWWCVVFPPLCLTDLALIPQRGKEARVESADDKTEIEAERSLEIRFKIVEIIKGIFNNR